MDINKLKGIGIIQNINFNKMAKQLNLTRQGFYQKMNKSNFYPREIVKIKEMLNLSEDEVFKIFF